MWFETENYYHYWWNHDIKKLVSRAYKIYVQDYMFALGTSFTLGTNTYVYPNGNVRGISSYNYIFFLLMFKCHARVTTSFVMNNLHASFNQSKWCRDFFIVCLSSFKWVGLLAQLSLFKKKVILCKQKAVNLFENERLQT